MSLILSRPVGPCPAQLCINFLFTDGTPDQIPLVNNVFLPFLTTLGVTNLVPGVFGYIPHNNTTGAPNNVPVVVCN